MLTLNESTVCHDVTHYQVTFYLQLPRVHSCSSFTLFYYSVTHSGLKNNITVTFSLIKTSSLHCKISYHSKYNICVSARLSPCPSLFSTHALKQQEDQLRSY